MPSKKTIICLKYPTDQSTDRPTDQPGERATLTFRAPLAEVIVSVSGETQLATLWKLRQVVGAAEVAKSAGGV